MVLLVELSAEGRKSAPDVRFDGSNRQGRQLCNLLMAQTLKEGQPQELTANRSEACDRLPHRIPLLQRIEQDLKWLIERLQEIGAFKLNRIVLPPALPPSYAGPFLSVFTGTAVEVLKTVTIG